MMERELVIGIPQVNGEKEVCGACLFGKQTRQYFHKNTTYQANTALERIHGDLC